MTNESVLQKLIYVIRKEKQSLDLQHWDKQKSIGYLSALGFVVDRIIEIQKDLHNERIESITVEMQHEIQGAYSNGWSDGQKSIIDIVDDLPSPNEAAVEYYNKTFVKK